MRGASCCCATMLIHSTRFSRTKGEIVAALTLTYPIPDSIVVSIPRCHRGDPGSIPGPGDSFFSQLASGFS